jgi:hypothetical protein
MTYDLRRAKGKLLPLSTIKDGEHLENTSTSQKFWQRTTYAHITHSHFFPIQALANKMSSFKEHGRHSPGSGMTRSKIVMLKVGDALRNLGRGVYVLSVSTALESKVITIKVPRYQLADISGHKLHLPEPPAKPTFGSNRTHEAMARPLDVRPRRSAISVSGTGSPLRREDARAILKPDQEHLTDPSNEKAESSSDAQATPEGIYGNPLKLLSLNQEDSPPLHQHMSLSLLRQKMQSPSPHLHIGLPLPDWRLRQAQFQRQLGLSAYKQQGSSPWLSRQTWDTKISLPTSSTPVEDLNHPLGLRYAPLPYILLTEYAPSSKPTLMNNQPLLLGSMSAAFTMKGRSHKPHSGVLDLPVSGSTAADPDDFETPEEFKEILTYSIEQMMFVSGETAEASPETTGMIEEIVRAQVIEMVSLFHPVSVAALPLMKGPPSAPALVISKFSLGPSHAYLAAAQTSDRACQSKRRPINFNCRSHLPHSPRQSQSFTAKNFPVVERRAEKCQRLRRERRWRRWGSRF